MEADGVARHDESAELAVVARDGEEVSRAVAHRHEALAALENEAAVLELGGRLHVGDVEVGHRFGDGERSDVVAIGAQVRKELLFLLARALIGNGVGEGRRGGRGDFEGAGRRGGRAMRHILAIASRELRSMFVTPDAYVLIGVYMLFAGFIFFASLGIGIWISLVCAVGIIVAGLLEASEDL